jgi:2-keto-4-pentenoate hydratase
MSEADVMMDAETVARAFVSARHGAQPLVDYPGRVPGTLKAAYQIQDLAIRLDGRAISGWKVGRIPSPLDTKFGTTRLAGPIFGDSIHPALPVRDMQVFAGGFGAIEAEFLFRLGDVPPGKTTWTAAEAMDCVTGVHVGFEIASSPFAGINELGPVVTVSDFGNNHGLVVGAALADWRKNAIDDMIVTTSIDGAVVGQGQASNFPGGSAGSIAFLLEHLALRGITVAAGTWISSGAVTGVHEISPGSTATADFGGLHSMTCRIVAATGRG